MLSGQETNRRKSSNHFAVVVTSMDAELEFNIHNKSTGKELFDLVCRTIGLRETWYCGLQYADSKGYVCWLKPNKRVSQQCPTNEASLHLLFLIKFYQEDVNEELIQTVTQHLFFLQVKQSILSTAIYCPPEEAVLLASYASQAMFGDYNENGENQDELACDELLPQRVLDQYQMTNEQWSQKILIWYADHRGLSKSEAEKEYLKVAQDLDMYGVNYFQISNKRRTSLWLGVTARGMMIFEQDDRLTPKIIFPWNEIKIVSFKGKKFRIKLMEKKDGGDFVFYAFKEKTNKLILELCVGNHEMHSRRRKPDTMEVQQMKAQAKDEKIRKQNERALLAIEKRKREQIQQDLECMEKKYLTLNEAYIRVEENNELNAEKARCAVEEAILLSQRLNDDQLELEEFKLAALKNEETKLVLEKRVHEAENLARKLYEENQFAVMRDNDILQKQLNESRHNQKLNLNAEMQLEIERENLEYREKQLVFQAQLNTLKRDIQVLKRDGKTTQFDILHDKCVELGQTKYETLQKIKTGTTMARVSFFEEL